MFFWCILLQNMEAIWPGTEWIFSVQTQKESQILHLSYPKRIICVYSGNNLFFFFFFFVQYSCTSNWADKTICFHAIMASLQEIPDNCATLCYDDELLHMFLPYSLDLNCSLQPCMCSEINWTLRLKGSIIMNQIVLRSPFLSCFLTSAALSNLKMGDITFFSLTVWLRHWIPYRTFHPLVKKQELIPRISTLKKQTKNPILHIDKTGLEVWALPGGKSYSW